MFCVYNIILCEFFSKIIASGSGVTFPSHLKKYVLHWDFDSKSWIVAFLTREKRPQNNFSYQNFSDNVENNYVPSIYISKEASSLGKNQFHIRYKCKYDYYSDHARIKSNKNFHIKRKTFSKCFFSYSSGRIFIPSFFWHSEYWIVNTRLSSVGLCRLQNTTQDTIKKQRYKIEYIFLQVFEPSITDIFEKCV